MRKHLINCFQNNKITPWSHEKCDWLHYFYNLKLKTNKKNMIRHTKNIKELSSLTFLDILTKASMNGNNHGTLRD